MSEITNETVKRLDVLIAKHDYSINDHEKRMRFLEKWLYLCVGGGGVIWALFEHWSHLVK